MSRERLLLALSNALDLLNDEYQSLNNNLLEGQYEAVINELESAISFVKNELELF